MAFNQHVNLASRYPNARVAASMAALPTAAYAAKGAITAEIDFVRSHRASGMVNVPGSQCV